MEYMQNLLYVMQADFICACKNTRTNAPSGRITRNYSSTRSLYPKVRTAHRLICRYNWIADYTIIMLVHKIT